MRFLLIAALVCWIIALAISLGAGVVLNASAFSWFLGGAIAVVLDWLVGERLATASARRSPPA